MANSSSRRSFLKANALTLAAAPAGYFVNSTVSSAQTKSRWKNERPQVCQIGVGGNGSNNASVAKEFCELVALCDVDRQHLELANKGLTNSKAETFADYREVLDREEIDIVVISTPDHWHTKILVEAMQAGKDAYCEKPLTLTIDEGKLIRRVQKETGRTVQVGTQQRSTYNLFIKALAILADGRLGKLHRVQTAIGTGGWSPPLPEAPVPETLDWDRWLGPAPKVPYRLLANPKQPQWPYTNCHGQFRWWYETSGGKLTDWGAHHVDIAMLGIEAAGQNNNLVSVEGTAKHAVDLVEGVPVQKDRFNTAQEFNLKAAFEENDVELVIRNDTDNGILFEGERGQMFVNRGKLVGGPVDELSTNPLPKDALQKIYRGMPMQFNERRGHWANFIYARENNVLPISDVHSHMKMLNVCHLAGICCRLGRKIHWDHATEMITGDPVAESMMQRPYRSGYEIRLA